jgi:hypothetical protein
MKGWGRWGGRGGGVGEGGGEGRRGGEGGGEGGHFAGMYGMFFTEYVSSAIKREKNSAMQIQYYPDCLLFIAL